MNCPSHPQSEVIGYCVVCGAFGCQSCLTLHEGNLLCSRHYKPIAKKIEENTKREDARKKHPRQRLVVRYVDGRCQYGVCFALNLKDTGFHLDLVNGDATPLGETIYVRFQDLKAVFLVKSFDGHFDKSIRYREWTPEGGELVVRFADGEVMRGFSLHKYDPDEPRFHLIPSNPATNNISALVEKRAVEGVYTPEEYKARLEEEQQSKTPSEGPVSLSQEETTGDFYFETRNYVAALEQYRQAASKFPRLHRLQKKILLTQYNVGVHFIKRHEYDKALTYMETVLKADPHNERVHKKVSQLRHIIQKGSRQSVAEREEL